MTDNTKNSDRRTFLKQGAASVAGLTALSGCTGAISGGGKSPLIIGAASPLSGPFSPWGTLHLDGLKFAAKELNANGGVLGQDVQIKSSDTQASPKKAVTAVQKLTGKENASVITGTVSSDVAIRVRIEAEKLKIPHLPNMGSTAQLLTKDTRYTFRTAALPAPYYPLGNSKVVKEQNIQKYGAIVADFSYGHSVKAGIEKYVKPIDGVEVNIQVAPPGEKNFKPYLKKFDDDVEMMDISGHPPGLFSIVKQQTEMSLSPKFTIAPTLPFQTFTQALGERVMKGLRFVPSIDPGADDYQKAGKRYYDETGKFFVPFRAFGYASANLIAKAAENAGSTEPKKIRDALSKINYDSVLSFPLSYTDWGELKNAKLTMVKFNKSSPPFYPKSDYYMEKVSETALDPIDPNNWK